MKKEKWNFIIIIVLAIISMLPILTEPHIQGHDTTFHLANINALSEELNTTLIPSKIRSEVGNNFGYGTHIFYPVLPHYFGAYTTKITNLFQIDTQTTMAFIYLAISIASAILIYYLAKKMTKKESISLISSIIYLFMPYRLGDIIVRCAYNEVFTFLFIPMILLSLLELVEKKRNNKKFYFLFIIGYTGLLYSHLSIALYFTVFLIPFVLIYRKELFQKETIITAIKGIITVTMLVLPMLIPILEHKLFGNYLVFKENYLSGLIYLETFNNTLKDYLIPKTDYSWEVPMFMNIIVIIMLVFSIITIIKQKKKEKNIQFLLWFSFIAFIVTLNFFPWKYVPSPFYMIQFAWRCQTFLAISISILAPIFICSINKKYINWVVTLCSLLIIGTSLPLLSMLSTHKYILENNISPNYAMGHSQEYLPENAYNQIDYFNQREEQIILLSGNANIELLSNHVPNLSFTVKDNKGTIEIELPRLYYKEYQLNGENVVSLKENQNGFLVATIKGNGAYQLSYTGTSLDKLANVLGILGIVYFVILLQKRTHKKVQ